MGMIKYYCGHHSFYQKPFLINTNNYCQFYFKDTDCAHCDELIVDEYLDSSPNIVTHTYKGNHRRTYRENPDAYIDFYGDILKNNPKFLEIT